MVTFVGSVAIVLGLMYGFYKLVTHLVDKQIEKDDNGQN